MRQHQLSCFLQVIKVSLLAAVEGSQGQRCFDNGNIVHVEGDVNPLRDIEIIETELIYADITQLEKKIERLKKQSKASKEAAASLVIAEEVFKHLEELQPVKTFENQENEVFIALDKELRFLSNKDVIYGANVDEDSLAEGGNKCVDILKEHAASVDAEVIVLCAKIEEELVGLEDEEVTEFLADLGVSESGLEQIIHKAFDKLGFNNDIFVGITGNRQTLRGDEIKDWIDTNNKFNSDNTWWFGDVDKYAIIDDDSDMLPEQMSSFFHVDGYYGLSPNTLYRIGRHFNKENE